MAGEKTIATLVGKLRFEADNRPLLTFEKNLDRVFGKVDKLGKAAGKKILLKVGIDTKSLTDNLKVARNVKIVLNNVDVSKDALSATMTKIASKLATTRIEIDQIKIPVAQLAAQKKLMRNLLESTTIDLPVDVKLRAAEKALRAWKKNTEAKLKLYLEADVSKHKLYQNVKKSIEFVTAKLGTVQFDPKIQLKVDRVALKAEINDVLKQIERQAKIRIQLTGNMGGGAGGGEGGSRIGFRQHAVTGGVAGAAAHWGRGFVPGLGGAFAVSQLNQINRELQAQQLAMGAVTGSDQAGAEQQAWVKNLSNTIGLNYREMTPAYTKMLASGQTSGMSQEGVQNIFQGVSEYGRVMGLDTESMKGSMRAIEQMMNKNQVMSEELKGQLAERMPGVISAMAEAAGFGTGEDAVAKLFKAMENGEVKSKEVLEKFAAILAERARRGDALAKAMKSTAAEQERFNNAFSDSVLAFAEGGFDKALASTFKEMASALSRSKGGVEALGRAFEILVKPFRAFVRLMGDLGEEIEPMAKALGVGKGEMVAFGLAAVANLTPLGRILTVISGIVLAVEDFVTFMKGGESQFGKWFEGLDGETQKALKDTGTELLGVFTKLGEQASLFATNIKDAVASIKSSDIVTVLNAMKEVFEAINAVLERSARADMFKNAVMEDFDQLNPNANPLARFAMGKAAGLMGGVLPEETVNNLMTERQMEAFKRLDLQRANSAHSAAADRQRGPQGIFPMAGATQTIERVEINITTENPEVIGDYVQKHLGKILDTTRTNLVETRR